ncbi:DUF2971 domain-containing protein [Gordonia sp. ABSL1-1]|uniref:DUF2971 domain-containing protein n=1 Tax=Gordonia sp. ABSL1-1 TaxID=3053923 RepID=UPI002573DFAE|nr:DUF2971 domain-containing protein [Gordonia sp. ABSL1-1]MDL9937185.1 DUF2971 domain-containing protein [Gordonia sp. ABSL1-1]
MPTENFDPDLPELLYHYTDIKGLDGIYNNGEIWLTDVRFLNDESELTLGSQLIQLAALTKVIGLKDQEIELREAGKSGDDSEVLALEKRSKHLSGVAESAKGISNPGCYVASLSVHGDHLGQWRAYGHEGYAIAIRTKELIDSLPEDSFLRRVSYVGYHQDDSIEVARTLGLFEALFRNLDENPVENQEAVVRSIISEDLAKYKNLAFRDESEVRMFVTGRPNLFTPSQVYGYVPRFRVKLNANSIDHVVVGPSKSLKFKVDGLFEKFWECDPGGSGSRTGGKVKVKRSQIPYRYW